MEEFSNNFSHGDLRTPIIFPTITQICDTNTNHDYGGGGVVFNQSSGGVDTMKAKIINHPHYFHLVSAYIDCQKVGATPEVAERLSTMAAEFEARRSTAMINISDDPELDQFMEAYYQMLVKFREELSRPVQEAMDFLKRVESQLGSMTSVDGGGSSSSLLLHSSGGNHGSYSSEEGNIERDTDQLPEIDAQAEEKELKHRLLKKYSGYLGSLRQELSKKKKRGKLPKEARQKLLSWWDLHHKWPYPSEAEKVALAEMTGLDQKQINNWFINQRKRHWKPSEEMQFYVENYYPHSTTPFYIEGHLLADSTYRFGP